jgi:dihydrofolate synthase/folylpolyglutamate synthase
LQESGYKVGLYTSPHFVKFNERIVINGTQIDDEYIAGFVADYENYIDEHQLTFFEVTTALAFKYFLEKKTDYCVIETGLGGRLDATNVLNPLAVVITTISLEHTNVLGNTITQIASEKAEIIKNNSKVFTGTLKTDATEVVEQKCKETKSQLFQLKDFISFNEKDFNLFGDEKFTLEINPPLKGKYQKLNAALAAFTISKTFPNVSKDNYLLGISNVVRNTGLQGRFEYFHRKPDIIFDSAHNPEGIENFLSEFNKESLLYSKKTLIFGAMRDKAIGDMLKMLSVYFDHIFITGINYERAATREEISKECQRLKINCLQVQRPEEFVLQFKNKVENV